MNKNARATLNFRPKISLSLTSAMAVFELVTSYARALLLSSIKINVTKPRLGGQISLAPVLMYWGQHSLLPGQARNMTNMNKSLKKTQLGSKRKAITTFWI